MRQITFDPYHHRGRITFDRMFKQEGRAMSFRNMSNLYRWTSTDDLEENLSRKYALLRREQRKPDGYWKTKEVDRLKHLIHQIEVELESRVLQQTYL